MDLLKCVKTVVDFFWDPWNQQIWVMWCDRGHFKCSSFAVGYPQIVLERLQDLLEKYLQSISLEFGISMDWYKSWSSYNHSPQFYHYCTPHVQRWRKILGISFVRNQVASVHGIFSWLVSIVSKKPSQRQTNLYTNYTRMLEEEFHTMLFFRFFREGRWCRLIDGFHLKILDESWESPHGGRVGFTHPSRLKWGFLYGFCLCLDTEKKWGFMW